MKTQAPTKEIVIRIREDFSPVVGGRKSADWKFSGEDFRKKVLEPKLKEALRQNVKLVVDMNGVVGYPVTFLEEAFRILKEQNPNVRLTDIIEPKHDLSMYVRVVKSYLA